MTPKIKATLLAPWAIAALQECVEQSSTLPSESKAMLVDALRGAQGIKIVKLRG